MRSVYNPSGLPVTWVVGKDPGEVYDALQQAADPGMHHERELTEFYDRLEK